MSKLKKLVYMSIFLLVLLYSSQVLATTGTVTASSIRLRKEASTSSEILTEVTKDEKVEVLENLEGWYKVKYKDYTGYMSSQYVEIDEQAQEEQPQEQNQEETQNNEEAAIKQQINQSMYITLNTNVYIIPSMSSSIINVINTDKQVTVEQTLNNWSYISFENITGWVRNAKLTNEAVTLPQEQETEEPQEQESTENQQQEEETVPSKGYINVSSANLREEPSTTSASIGGLILNEQVEILEKLDGWYKIIADGKTGYVASKLVSANPSDTSRGTAVIRPVVEQEAEVQIKEQSINKTMYVSVNSARVRSKPDTSSSIVTNLSKAKEVKVVAQQDNWYKIEVNGKTGYIRNDLVTEDLSSVKPAASTSSANTVVTNLPSTGDKGTDVVNFATQFLGYKYVLGGTTPSTGFDCSGFVYYIYNQCGISISRSLSAQASAGAHVDKSQLQPGDILIFSTGVAGQENKLGHSGIYIGNNQMIHAANSRRGVVTDTIASGYYKDNYIKARRVIL